MDKVQNKPNSSVQHTPSSESFQVYPLNNIFIYWFYFQIIELHYKIEEFLKRVYLVILSYILSTQSKNIIPILGTEIYNYDKINSLEVWKIKKK
jgi:hypothetical protein